MKPFDAPRAAPPAAGPPPPSARTGTGPPSAAATAPPTAAGIATTGTTSTFRALQSRNFRLFFGGQLVSQVGNWITLVAQTLLVLHLTGDGIAVGLLAACQFAPVLVLGAWSGLLADRSDKRRLLIAVQVAAMAQSGALAVLAFLPSPPLLAIYAVALVGGVTVALDNPARRAFVVEMVPEADVPNAVSLNSALMTGSRIVGPALAGLLIGTTGFGWCFLLDAISYLAVIAALGAMRPAELRPSPVAARAKGQVRQGLRYARSIPELWIPLVMTAVIGALAFNFQVVVPLFVTKTFGADDVIFTILFSVISAGSLVGALATARRKEVVLRHVIVGSAAFGAAMLAFAAAPGLALAYPIGIVVGVTSMMFMTSATALVQLRADPAMRGRVLALQAILFLGSTPIGGPLLGWVCEVFGARVGLVVGGVSALVAAAWGHLAVRRVRSSAARAAGSAEAATPSYAHPL